MLLLAYVSITTFLIIFGAALPVIELIVNIMLYSSENSLRVASRCHAECLTYTIQVCKDTCNTCVVMNSLNDIFLRTYPTVEWYTTTQICVPPAGFQLLTLLFSSAFTKTQRASLHFFHTFPEMSTSKHSLFSSPCCFVTLLAWHSHRCFDHPPYYFQNCLHITRIMIPHVDSMKFRLRDFG